MDLKKFHVENNQKLSKFLSFNLGISYNTFQKLLKGREIKINGIRVSKDILLNAGDVVEVYFQEKPIKVIYEDKDVVVVFKTRGIETYNDLATDLKSKIESQIGSELFAVHRLDVNTEGLVVFAKNQAAKISLDNAIKNRRMQKFYLAKVSGNVHSSSEKLTAYLKKDSEKARVYISDKKLEGYEQIQTNYKLIKKVDEFSILEVELVTGKTHQIRAHLSHIGLPILGDDKYGNFEINKKHCKKYQCLCAYKLIFHFEKDDFLSRIDGLEICLDNKDIEFL